MRILHVVPGLDEVGNGISVAAKLIANEQGADLVEARMFARGKCDASQYDEVWVHSAWSPMVLRSCRRVLKSGKQLVRMAHANYDPVRLAYHGWKKRIVSPVDRYYLRKAVKVVATCEAEKGWIESYLGRRCPPIALTDIKRFFDLPSVPRSHPSSDRLRGSLRSGDTFPVPRPLHLLYLGRRHPLKGLFYLESALATYYNMWSKSSVSPSPTNTCTAHPSGNPSSEPSNTTYYNKCPIDLRVVSSAFGDELEKVWDWCDVLVLPTLSENFGLVIAEALERGKRVITTDGAPAWGDNLSRAPGSSWSSELELESGSLNSPVEHEDDGEILFGYDGRLIYLKGYRDGSNEQRVELLKNAIEKLCRAEHKG